MCSVSLRLVAFARLCYRVLKIFDVIAVVVKVVHVIVFICQLVVVRVSEANFTFAELVDALLVSAEELRRLRLLHHFRLPEVDVHLMP